MDKLAELNNIIIGCVLSTQKLKVKEANMICWYILQKILYYRMLNLLMFFIIN